MSNLDEKNFERILNVIGPFIMSEVEEIVPFDTLSNEKREEVLKLVMKSSEVSLIILDKIIKKDSIESDTLDHLEGLIQQNKFEEAVQYINK